MTEVISAQQFRDLVAQSKRNKFNAKPVTIDGIRFHSKGEGDRWQCLKLLERAGQIKELRRQVRFHLAAIDSDYIADFTYHDCKTGRRVVEDFKGVITREFRFKAKVFATQYGFEITITGKRS